MDGSGETDIVMPFGKYKGRLVSDIPQDYLEWFADNVKTKPALAEAVSKAIGRTGPGPGQPQNSHPQKSKGTPSFLLTGSDYVPSNDTTCPFDCE